MEASSRSVKERAECGSDEDIAGRCEGVDSDGEIL